MQQRLTDLGRDTRIVEAADAIIDLDSCAVSKPVRGGFTTSTVIACDRRGLKCLVIAPTRKILKETVRDASSNSIRIPSNAECFVIQDMIKETPLLAQLPMPLPDCEQCQARYNEQGWDQCEVHSILRAKDFSIAALTYQKLLAIMLSEGKMAEDIRAKLSGVDVVLLDEAHELALPKTASVPVNSTVEIPPLRYMLLDTVCLRWKKFCREHEGVIKDLLDRARQGYAGQHLAMVEMNKSVLYWKDLKKIWKELAQAAIDKKIDESDILRLRDIIHILSAPQVSFNYISENEGCKGGVIISAEQTRFLRAIEEFLTEVVPEAKHIFGSATLFEPYEGFFSTLSGKDIRQAVFPDIRGTAKKMTLIADRWRLTSYNFDEKLPIIVKTVEAIAMRENQAIYLLAPNARKAEVLQKALKDIPNLFIDYYRSDRTIGVERPERVCISVGLAETPANSCDPLARGKTSEDRWLDSRRLRLQGVHASSWQAVNRVRDPTGEVESHVYFIGCRLEQVRKVATWGTKRQLMLKEIREHKSSRITRVAVFDVHVEEPIEIPKILADETIADHPERRKAGDYIKSIENSLKMSTFMAQSIYNIIRGNGSKVGVNLDCCKDQSEESTLPGIYNYPKNEIEMASTCAALFTLLCHRTDCFAVQYHNSKTSKWEYTKIQYALSPEDLIVHTSGHYSLGAYQLAPDDTVKWICFDIDNPDSKCDAKSDVKKLIVVLRQYSIPFLLEASGSPDSYHIWIFLAKTQTINAFKFSRQIQAEADIKCEIFPKQKGLTTKNQYGNLVKLPVCINRKSGARSVFLDPDTFEPLAGPIYPPGIVYLYELPESAELTMPRVRTGQYNNAPGWLGQRRPNSATSLNYCIQKVLDDRIPLEESEGHDMRIAIASYAYRSGYSIDRAVELFKDQPDFDPDKTRKFLDYIYRNDYHRYSCETLQNKCGQLVKPYCPTCTFGAKSVAKNETVRKENEHMIIENLYEYGFGEGYGSHSPPRKEVELCKQWIYQWCIPQQKINAECNSYTLKHAVERWAKTYIPNGAFIQAAIELDYKYERHGPNARFNMSYARAKKQTEESGWR